MVICSVTLKKMITMGYSSVESILHRVIVQFVTIIGFYYFKKMV